MCNGPKFVKTEVRTGAGGGYNERDGVEYKEREESDDEFDEVVKFWLKLSFVKKITSEILIHTKWNEQFGRKKKKFRAAKLNDDDETESEDDEEDDDDEDGDLSKYQLDGDDDDDKSTKKEDDEDDEDDSEDEDDFDASKYDLIGDVAETDKSKTTSKDKRFLKA